MLLQSSPLQAPHSVKFFARISLFLSLSSRSLVLAPRKHTEQGENASLLFQLLYSLGDIEFCRLGEQLSLAQFRKRNLARTEDFCG